MKKGKGGGKNRSQISVMPVIIPEAAPLDVLSVKIKSVRVTEDITVPYSINVVFYDQLILSGVIKSIAARAEVKERTVLLGRMGYDPSDYEKMSIMSDNPLCVQIQPLRNDEPNYYYSAPSASSRDGTKSSKGSSEKHLEDMSCCNIDILPLLLEKTKKHVKKRMQPLIKQSILYRKSWDNLPLLNIKLEVFRNPKNQYHHEVLKKANYMQLTLIGAYNMLVPYNNDYVYTAASRMPFQNIAESGVVTYNHGHRLPRRFNSLNFNPNWESLKDSDRNFPEGDVKYEAKIEDVQNDEEIPIHRYMDNPLYSAIWGSFHRSLMLNNADKWMWRHLRDYHWPVEVHIYGETRGFSFMGFLNMFQLLYPGEDRVLIAAPLHWVNQEAMQQMCGCDLILTPNDKASTVMGTSPKMTKQSPKPDSGKPQTSPRDDAGSYVRKTGSDDNSAFILVEVKFGRPLREVVIPPVIPGAEINGMLLAMDQAGPQKRECTGRGQQDRDWNSTVRNAASALRKVPYYGMTEFCSFNRQLSETRTRVELMTSCWQDAAVFVNNNFVVQDFLRDDKMFEEMLMMSHACLMRTACVTLVGDNYKHSSENTLRAARHARQMQDISHAMELYLQLVVQRPRDPNSWRELATCLRDVDRDWAKVCINKSVVLDPRHPLSLVSKGCMLYEEDPDLAEPFFVALLAMYPYWSTGWVVANAYYIKRELYHMADKIMELSQSVVRDGKMETFDSPRSWEHELGDWWDHTPILAGMSPYYDAADFLLRLRAIDLAEVCVSLALCEGGETAAYYQLLALSCRLQGKIEDALCHVRAGIDKFGEISYLRTLEAECCHKLEDIEGATAAFEKAGSCVDSYSVLLSTPCREQQRARTVLVDLSRRQPSAYVWLALANDWMIRAASGEAGPEIFGIAETSSAGAKTCAAVCAVQALKWDRRATKAWALLATLVKPSARRLHCMQMAEACGYSYKTEEKVELKIGSQSQQSLCYRLSKTLKECRCTLCELTTV